MVTCCRYGLILARCLPPGFSKEGSPRSKGGGGVGGWGVEASPSRLPEARPAPLDKSQDTCWASWDA